MGNMHNMPAVSVIMPVYNTGLFLDIAIKSVLNQTSTDFELILVDDGSIDGSSQKCDEYAKKDKGVKVLHQKNRGICNARNSAIKICKGFYVAFIDHDDEYSVDLIQTVFSKATNVQADIVKFGKKELFINDEKVVYSWSTNPNDRVYQNEEIESVYFELVNSRELDCVWDALYRRTFLLDNNLFFDENFQCGGEDIEFNTRAILASKKFCTIPTILYTHYLRTGFSTSAKFDERKIQICKYQLEKFNKNIFENKVEPARYKEAYIYFGMYYCFNLTAALLASPSCHYTHEYKVKLLDNLRYIELLPNWFFSCNFNTIRKMPKKLILSYYLYKYHFYTLQILINMIAAKTKVIRKKYTRTNF